jgi:hypothetical protein
MAAAERSAMGLLAVLAAGGAWLAAAGVAELPPPAARSPSAPRACAVAVDSEPSARDEVTAPPAATTAGIVPAPTASESPLRSVAVRIASGDADHEAVREMRDLLVATPELAAQVPDLLQQLRACDLVRRRLLQALELCGTPPCQAALVQIADDAQHAQQDRALALAALGRVPEPTADTMTRLWASFARADRDLSRAALLAYGRAAAAVRASDPARGVEATTALARALQGATDRDGMITALRAIARCGDAALAQTVAPFLTAVDGELRSAAEQALAASGGS